MRLISIFAGLIMYAATAKGADAGELHHKVCSYRSLDGKYQHDLRVPNDEACPETILIPIDQWNPGRIVPIGIELEY